MVQIARQEATSILGRPVMDSSGEVAGRIVDVLVDGSGQTRAVVVDIGGFLGMGQRRVAVAWAALSFSPDPPAIKVQLTAAEIAAAPEFKPDSGADLVVAPHP